MLSESLAAKMSFLGVPESDDVGERRGLRLYSATTSSLRSLSDCLARATIPLRGETAFSSRSRGLLLTLPELAERWNSLVVAAWSMRALSSFRRGVV